MGASLVVAAACRAGRAGAAPTNLAATCPAIPTLELARRMAAAAESRAASLGTRIVVTVVDDGAHEVLVERMAGAQLASLELSRRKAVSAVLYQRPSSAFEKALAGGKMAVLALPDAMPAGGGLPLACGGRLLGAVGVSGGNNAQDETAAGDAVAAVRTP